MVLYNIYVYDILSCTSEEKKMYAKNIYEKYWRMVKVSIFLLRILVRTVVTNISFQFLSIFKFLQISVFILDVMLFCSLEHMFYIDTCC
jgi:hypothetical protein